MQATYTLALNVLQSVLVVVSRVKNLFLGIYMELEPAQA